MIKWHLKRRFLIGLAVILLGLPGWFAFRAFSERRLVAGLLSAARDMEAGNVAAARIRLAHLAARWPGRPEVLFRLGESESNT